MIGLFLAMLELIRNRLIWAEQPDSDGPVYLKPLTSEPAEEAVHNAIYASSEAMEEKASDADNSSWTGDSIDDERSLTEEDEPSETDELTSLSSEESTRADVEEGVKRAPIRIMDIPSQPQELQTHSEPIGQQDNSIQE